MFEFLVHCTASASDDSSLTSRVSYQDLNLFCYFNPSHRRGIIMTMALITKCVLICTYLITAFSKIQREEWRPSRIDTRFLFLYRVVIQEIHASLWRILFCEVFNLITYRRTEKIVGWVFWFFWRVSRR